MLQFCMGIYFYRDGGCAVIEFTPQVLKIYIASAKIYNIYITSAKIYSTSGEAVRAVNFLHKPIFCSRTPYECPY